MTKSENLEPRFDAAAIHIYFEFWQLGEHLSSKIIVETKKEYLILWQPIDYAATVIQTQFQLLSLKYNLLSSPGNLSNITQMQLQNYKNASSDPYCISNVIFLDMAPFQKQY